MCPKRQHHGGTKPESGLKAKANTGGWRENGFHTKLEAGSDTSMMDESKMVFIPSLGPTQNKRAPPVFYITARGSLGKA